MVNFTMEVRLQMLSSAINFPNILFQLYHQHPFPYIYKILSFHHLSIHYITQIYYSLRNVVFPLICPKILSLNFKEFALTKRNQSS